MPYRDSLPKRVPPWFGDDGRDQMRAVGDRLDVLRGLFREAVLARLPGLAPADALPIIGGERLLPQGPGETDEDYTARLVDAWAIWGGDDTPLTGVGGGAGSALGLLNALAAAGYPTGPDGATIVQQCGRDAGQAVRGYAQLSGGGVLVLGALMMCENRVDLTGAVNPRRGWTFNTNDNFWSIFGLVFPETTSIDAAELNAIVVKWRPAKALFFGTWVIDTGGRSWGWPTSETWGSGNWGGNTVTFYPGPNGEATLAGYIP